MAYLDVSDDFKTIDFKSNDLKNNNFSRKKKDFQATLKFKFSKTVHFFMAYLDVSNNFKTIDFKSKDLKKLFQQ